MTMNRIRLVLSNRMRERLALQIMYLVGCNHYHNKPPWNLKQFTERMDLPGESIYRSIRFLVDTGYLAEIATDEPPVYLPVHDIGTIRLVDMLSDIRAAGETQFLGLRHLVPLAAIDRLMAQLTAASAAALGDRTLRDLVLDDTGAADKSAEMRNDNDPGVMAGAAIAPASSESL